MIVKRKRMGVFGIPMAGIGLDLKQVWPVILEPIIKLKRQYAV